MIHKAQEAYRTVALKFVSGSSSKDYAGVIGIDAITGEMVCWCEYGRIGSAKQATKELARGPMNNEGAALITAAINEQLKAKIKKGYATGVNTMGFVDVNQMKASLQLKANPAMAPLPDPHAPTPPSRSMKSRMRNASIGRW